MTEEEIAIQSFLRLGYFVTYRERRAPIDYSRIDRRAYDSASREELVRTGIGKLHATFDELWCGDKEHVVPLSGGLDSRLILGALLERTEANKIQTYTFGIPGSYDYEIGNTIAKALGTRHASIPLNSETAFLEDEVQVAARTGCQAVLFHHPPLWKLDRLFPGSLFWSGFVGDAVAGSHLRRFPSPTLEEAKRSYLKERSFVKSVRLYSCDDEELLPYIDGGGLDPEVLTWDEQVLFDEAAVKFTAPLVLMEGYSFVTPLINSPWMDFMFSVPNYHRFGERLMIDIGRRAFPRLFGFRSKNRVGHTFNSPDVFVRGSFWLNRVRKVLHQFVPSVNWPNHQYDDFNEALRESPDLRGVVRGAIERLRRRGTCDWVDFDGLWRRHDRRVRNHGDALIVLASLEIVLEAKESVR